MSGSVIYAIRHRASGRLYIGSAVDCARRWNNHRHFLDRGNHHNTKLQNSWNKYGPAMFDFMAVQRVEPVEELIFWEQFWIDALKPWFNLSPTAGSILGLKLSPEAREKIAASKRGIRLSDAHKRAVGDAQRGRMHTAEHRERHAAAARGSVRSAEARAATSQALTGRVFKPETIARQVAANSKTVALQNPEGEVVQITNLARFCREHGLDGAAMHRVATGRARSYKGWRSADAK